MKKTTTQGYYRSRYIYSVCVNFFCVLKYVHVKFNKRFENNGFMLINWMTSFSPFSKLLVFSQMIIVFIIYSFYKCV